MNIFKKEIVYVITWFDIQQKICNFYQRFELDLCKERSWGPPKSEVVSSLCFVVVDESRVPSDASEGGRVLLKALRDWWQPKGGKVKFEGKE